MTDTALLSLPLLAAAQAQKHVTHNDALLKLDAVVQLAVLDRDLVVPPGEPADGDRYIVAAGATEAWSGHDGEVAAWQGGGWVFLAPRPGWLAWVLDEAAAVHWSGGDWVELASTISALQNLALLGVGTAADAANPFSAKLNKALWTAKSAGEGGDGSLRYTLNKEGEGDVLSLLMQSDWSGRAEIGLIGDEDLSVRVSADGDGWTESLKIGRSDGRACFPQGIAHAESGLTAALYLPSPVKELWRLDASRAATPRTFTIGAVSGAAVTLTTASVNQIYSTGMRGNTAVRVWNVSKSPAEAAWVDWNESSTQLRVTDAAHVAGWSSGETLRLGDPNPTGDNTLEMVALDIGGYLLGQLGAVFPQKGVMLGVACSSSNGPAAISLSPNGAINSAFGGNALSDGKFNSIAAPIVTSVPSPISNSNLVFLREALNGAADLAICYARVLGVYV